MRNENRFSRSQMMITIHFMIAYSVLYFMRLNVSLALTGMEDTFAVDPMELGIVSTAFFWCYAFGQLIFGFVGDHLPARYMVTVGLLGSGVLNLAVSFSPSIALVTAFWAANGLFQSMLWSPMMRCVSVNFEGKKKVSVTFALSFTQVIGYILAWVGSYFIEVNLNWRYVFRIPALLGIAYAIVFFVCFRYSSRSEKASVVESANAGKRDSLIRQPALVSFLGVIAIVSIFLGLVRSSMDTWIPTMLEDFGGLSEEGIVVTLVLIPLLNFVGILLAKYIVKKFGDELYMSVLVVWGVSLLLGVVTLILFGMNTPVLYVVIVCVLFGCVYGLTPLFTSFVPLDFAKWNCVSTVTGFVDFAIYFGAGITGVVSGYLLGSGPEKNWSALNYYWVITLVVGMAICVAVYFWHRKLRKRIAKEGV